MLQRYDALPSYRRLLDIEGATHAGETSIVGNGSDVEQQLRDLAAIGVTDFGASIFPTDDKDMIASVQRTWTLLNTTLSDQILRRHSEPERSGGEESRPDFRACRDASALHASATLQVEIAMLLNNSVAIGMPQFLERLRGFLGAP